MVAVKRNYPVHELGDWLKVLTGGGPRRAANVARVANQMGYGRRCLGRAVADLKVNHLGNRGRSSATWWALPEHADAQLSGVQHSALFPSRSVAAHVLGTACATATCPRQLPSTGAAPHPRPYVIPPAATGRHWTPGVRTLATDRFGLDVQVHAATLSHLDVHERLAGQEDLHQVLVSCLPGYEISRELPERLVHQFEDDGEAWGQYRRSLVLTPWSELPSGLPKVVFGYQPLDTSDPFLKVGLCSSMAQLLDLDLCDEILRLVTETLCTPVLHARTTPEQLFRLAYLEATYDQPVHWLRFADAHAAERALGVQDDNIALNLHRGACTYGKRDGHRHAASYLKQEDGIVLLRRECRMHAHQLHERLGIENNRQLRSTDWSRLFHLQLGGPMHDRMRMRMAEYQAQFRQATVKPLVETARSWGSGGLEPATVIVSPEPIVGDLADLVDARHLAAVLPSHLAKALAVGEQVLTDEERIQLVADAPEIVQLLADVVQVDVHAVDPQRVRRHLGELLLQLPTFVFRLRTVIVSRDNDAVRLAAVALLDAIQQLHGALRVWIIEQLNATHTKLTHEKFEQLQQLATDHVMPEVEQWQALLATPHPRVPCVGSSSMSSPASPTTHAEPASSTTSGMGGTSPRQVVQSPTASPPCAPSQPPPPRRRQWQTGPANLHCELTAAKIWGVPGVDEALVEIAPLSFTRAHLAEIVRRTWPRATEESVEVAAAFLALISAVRAGNTSVWREHEIELTKIQREVQPWVPRKREVEAHGTFFWKHFPRQSVHLAVGVLIAQHMVTMHDVAAITTDATAVPVRTDSAAARRTTQCGYDPLCSIAHRAIAERMNWVRGHLHRVVRQPRMLDDVARTAARPSPMVFASSP